MPEVIGYAVAVLLAVGSAALFIKGLDKVLSLVDTIGTAQEE